MIRRPSAGRVLFPTILAAVCLSLAACGFHLRGSGPGIAQKLYLEGLGPGDSFVGTFGNAMSLAGGKVVPEAGQAGGVIHIYKASHFRRYLALSRAGRSVLYDLSYRVVYDVRTPKGEVLLPRQEIETKRDYFNDQTLPLGQAEEEGLIRQELEKEAAQALLRRAVFALSKAPEKKT
ncbi:MAG TPA: LPS assembly lipoprotein LptE [Methylococcaceae bacterium]|nr:LPS assembly lipoprotein LptE [Methylococcaceae bacterium]